MKSAAVRHRMKQNTPEINALELLQKKAPFGAFFIGYWPMTSVKQEYLHHRCLSLLVTASSPEVRNQTHSKT